MTQKPFYAQKPQDLLGFDEMLSLSGLEFMQGILDGRFPQPPIAKTLNYHLHHVEEGSVAFRGVPEFDHMNPMGGVHGGWFGTIMDSALACSVMTLVPKGRFYTTLEYKVNITGALKLGTLVEARGHVQHMGKSTGVSHAELRGVKDGRLYATGSTTCMIMDPK